jgi:hypothetical protein
MKRLLLTVLLATTLSNQTWSATAIGVIDCGQWVQDQSKTQQRISDRSWLIGFLSGLNQNDFYKNAFDKVSSAQQVYLWMDNYCKANPLQNVADGGEMLMFELLQKK